MQREGTGVIRTQTVLYEYSFYLVLAISLRMRLSECQNYSVYAIVRVDWVCSSYLVKSAIFWLYPEQRSIVAAF